MDEELLSRQPPQSLEAEQAVLGSILIDSRCVADVIGIVTPDDFYLQQNKEIFEAVPSVIGLGIKSKVTTSNTSGIYFV